MDSEHLLLQAVVVLCVAVVVVPVFQRLRISPVLGYLVAGAAVGPHGLALIADAEGTLALAETGVVFLLFTLGLELSVERLRAMRRHIFGLGTAQVLSCAVVLATAAWMMGLEPASALVVGSALALSSTAVIIQTLREHGNLIARVGRVSFAVLLLQDMAVAPLLALIPLLATDPGSLVPALAEALAKAVLAVTVIFAIGRWAMQPIFHYVSEHGSRETFVAMALLTALGIGLVTQQLGLSMALGAFLAGLTLAGTQYRHQVEVDIEPFRGILLGLFFMAIGMLVDPGLVSARAVEIAGIVVVLLAVKAAIVISLCRAFRMEWPLAVRVGLLLAGGGEFAFAILGLGLARGLLIEANVQTLIVAVALSMVLTPVLAQLGEHIAASIDRRTASRRNDLAIESADLANHVVIIGFGRVGQTIAKLLSELNVPHLALDLDAGRVSAARQKGSHVYYGDSSQLAVLQAAGVARAKSVVVTVNQPHLVERIVVLLRQNFPRLDILARAHDGPHSEALERAGASRAVPETLEASLQLGRAVLTTVGAPLDDVRRIIREVREQHYASIEEVVADTAEVPSGAGTERWKA